MSEFVRACALDQGPEQGTFGGELNGRPLGIVRSRGEVFALDELSWVCDQDSQDLNSLGCEGDDFTISQQA